MAAAVLRKLLPGYVTGKRFIATKGRVLDDASRNGQNGRNGLYGPARGAGGSLRRIGG